MPISEYKPKYCFEIYKHSYIHNCDLLLMVQNIIKPFISPSSLKASCSFGNNVLRPLAENDDKYFRGVFPPNTCIYILKMRFNSF